MWLHCGLMHLILSRLVFRLIGYGFKCHEANCNGGMSVPLLSVNLASLMAIFRSDDISKTVRVEDLAVLIKEAGKALLDPRLAASSQLNALDEATSTQMVRAINKVSNLFKINHYCFYTYIIVGCSSWRFKLQLVRLDTLLSKL